MKETWLLYAILLGNQKYIHILLVPRNSGRGRGLIPSLTEQGEQSYELMSAWGTTSLECIVLKCGQV
jgi:hypothetical protein